MLKPDTIKITLPDGSTKYIEMIVDYLPFHRQGVLYTKTGYGAKIPTTKKVLYNNRWCRVYCCIDRNSGSFYIVSKGGRLYIG